MSRTIGDQAKEQSVSVRTLPGCDYCGEDMERAVNLLDEGRELKKAIEQADARLEEIKAELLAIQIEYELPGFRNGNVAFIGSMVEGRRVLDKELLMENGVSPEQISQSYKMGNGYWKKEIKEVKS